MVDKPLPCPFCGNDVAHRRFTGNGFTLPRVEYTQVTCVVCKIGTEPMQPSRNKDHALIAWNRRD